MFTSKEKKLIKAHIPKTGKQIALFSKPISTSSGFVLNSGVLTDVSDRNQQVSQLFVTPISRVDQSNHSLKTSYFTAVSGFDGQVNELIRQDSVIYLDQSIMAKNTFDKIPPSLSYKQPISNFLLRLIYEPKN